MNEANFFQSEQYGAHWGWIPFKVAPVVRGPQHEPEVQVAKARMLRAFKAGLFPTGLLYNKNV